MKGIYLKSNILIRFYKTLSFSISEDLTSNKNFFIKEKKRVLDKNENNKSQNYILDELLENKSILENDSLENENTNSNKIKNPISKIQKFKNQTTIEKLIEAKTKNKNIYKTNSNSKLIQDNKLKLDSIENLPKNIEDKSRKNDNISEDKINIKNDKEEKNLQIFKPKEIRNILNFKTNIIYKYDTIHLLEVLKKIDLKLENSKNILFILSTIRKKDNMKHYETQEILNAVYFLHSNIESLNLSQNVSFLYNLSKMNYFNNDSKLIYDIVKCIFHKIQEFANSHSNLIPIRESSNFIKALCNFTMLKPKEFVFNDLFLDFENILVKSIIKTKLENISTFIDSLSFTEIILSYSKTQNGSKEFYSFLSQIVEHLNIKSIDHLSTIVYSVSNNINCDEVILVKLVDNIIEGIDKSKPKELISILRAYNRKNLLNEYPILKSKLIIRYYELFKFANPIDVSYMYDILAEENFKIILENFKFVRKSEIKKFKKYAKDIENNGKNGKISLKSNSNEIDKYENLKMDESSILNKKISDSLIENLYSIESNEEKGIINDISKLVEYIENNKQQVNISSKSKNSVKFFEYLHSQINNLCFSFEGNEISLLFKHALIIYDLDSNLYAKLCGQVQYLMKKNKISGHDLDIIHYGIRNVPTKSKYNYFKEEIENKLRKMKYFI